MGALNDKVALGKKAADVFVPPPQRAGERVRESLLAEFERQNLKPGSRLPSIRDLAARLAVSTRTVQTSLQRLAREGQVRVAHGSGTYLVQRTRKRLQRLTFAVGMPQPGSALDDPWHHGIYGGMLSAALRSAVPISFLPAWRESGLDADVARNLLDQRSQADGLILFPFHRQVALYEEVREAYEKEGKPVVTLHPLSQSVTTNFVSPDYVDTSHRLGKAWKQTGRRNIVLLCGSLRVSTSSRLRWAGLVNAFGADLGKTVSCRFVTLLPGGPSTDGSGYQTMRQLLDRGQRPDAVFAMGDLVALGALRALREAGLRLPEDVSVVGGSGIDLNGTICPQLTRSWQPLASLGENLVEMLMRRIELRATGNSNVSGLFLPSGFIGGETTRSEENELLGLAGRDKKEPEAKGNKS